MIRATHADTDAAYAAFLSSLTDEALRLFDTEFPKAPPITRKRFAGAVGEELRQQFPPWRFERYIRDEPPQYEAARALVEDYVREALKPCAPSYQGDALALVTASVTGSMIAEGSGWDAPDY